MTFDSSAVQADARDRAREFAVERAAPLADGVDQTRGIPEQLDLSEMARLASRDSICRVLVLEEIGCISASIAAAVVFGASLSAESPMPGLRGVTARGEDRLSLAAIAIGIGRRAIEAALDGLREPAARAEDAERPHWVVADAATEIDAARLMTLAAAQSMDRGRDVARDVALATLTASHAAQLAVDAALRVVGPAGYREGALLERLSRDAKTIALLGGEEPLRSAAAAEMFPA